MDPFTIGLAIAFFGAIAVAIAAVTAKRIRDWFRSRGQIKASNAKAIAFTLANLIEERKYAEVTGVFGDTPKRTQIVQGFYDPDSGRLLDARALASNETTDQEVVERHEAGHGLVIYT